MYKITTASACSRPTYVANVICSSRSPRKCKEFVPVSDVYLFSTTNCDCLFGNHAHYYFHYFRYYSVICTFSITCVTFNRLSAVVKFIIKLILL